MARALALTVVLLLAGCSWTGPRIRAVEPAEWEAALAELRGSPVAVFVWAAWSRSSVELLPTIVELQREFEPRGVQFLTVCLHDPEDDSANDAARRLVRRLDARFPHYRLKVDYLTAAELVGAASPPALALFCADGSRVRTLQGEEESDARLAPADISDALEALAEPRDAADAAGIMTDIPRREEAAQWTETRSPAGL